MVGWVAFEVSLRWVEPVKTVKNATANLSFDLISILALRVIQSHSLKVRVLKRLKAQCHIKTKL